MAKVERKYWNPEIETMPLDKLKRLQEERLQSTVARAYEKSAFYHRKFDAAGVKPGDIRTIEDVRKLPLIEDAEFRATPLTERLTTPFSEVKKICSSGGTTGIPSPLPRTAQDWEDIVEGNARTFWTAGIHPGDIVQVRQMYECIGLALARMGVSSLTICAGRGFMDNQIRLAQMMDATIIIDGPSLLLQYLRRAEELGIYIKDTKLRGAWVLGEGWSKGKREAAVKRTRLPI